jgi:hypothetical protein
MELAHGAGSLSTGEGCLALLARSTEMRTWVCDPSLSQVIAVRLCGATNMKSEESVGLPLIIWLKLRMAFVSRLKTQIGKDQGEWPPDDDRLKTKNCESGDHAPLTT